MIVDGRIGRLVCVEGIDGAGKSTGVAAAGVLLRMRGVKVAVVDKNTCSFPSPYVDRHMRQVRDLIWGHPPDDPYLELGDLHWVHLHAAWYLAMAHRVVVPLLEAGTVVLTDTWTHKFLAKRSLRPGVDLDHVRSSFAEVIRPDLVIRLDLDPAVAAVRKQVIALSEAGNHEGVVSLDGDSFVAYQRRLAGALDTLGQAHGWQRLDVTERSVGEVAARVAAMVADHVGLVGQTASPAGST